MTFEIGDWVRANPTFPYGYNLLGNSHYQIENIVDLIVVLIGVDTVVGSWYLLPTCDPYTLDEVSE